MFGAQLADHKLEDNRRFQELRGDVKDLRADLDLKHRENQAATAAMLQRIDDQRDASRRRDNKALVLIITTLLAVLGAILTQSFHFKVSLGDPPAMATYERGRRGL